MWSIWRFGSADTSVQMDSEWIIKLMSLQQLQRHTFFGGEQTGGSEESFN